MRFHLPRRRIWRISIYLVSLLLVIVAADMVLVQIRRGITPGYDTTRVIAPTLADGRIDYLTAVEARGDGVTPQNNAAVLFLEAVGRGALPKSQPPDGITNKLGMPPLPEQGDYLTEFPGGPTAMPDAPTQWPLTISPAIADWIKANEKPLAVLTEASKRTRFFIPFDGGNRPAMLVSVLIPHVQFFHRIGSLLLNRAAMSLDGGDFEGFHGDLLTAQRLARLISQAGTLIEWKQAESFLEEPACILARAGAASGKLTSAQARKLAADEGALGDLPPIEPFIDRGERYMVLDLLQLSATLPPNQAGQLFNDVTGSATIQPVFAFWLIPVPYEQAMRELNQDYDGALVALHQPTYAARSAAMKLLEGPINDDGGRNVVANLLSPRFLLQTLMLAVDRIADAQETAKAQNRLTRIALALAAYHADHGSYPKTLAELLPEYLLVVPDDPFSDRPMTYARSGAGYTLYSLGPRIEDHGGGMDNISANVP